MVDVTVKLSYRVNFEGDPSKWFNVENYVKFLCDHCRSLLKKEVKTHGVEEMNARAIDIVRDALLGKGKIADETVADDADKDEELDELLELEKIADESSRPGRIFDENGMRIYDVEVLKVTIGDDHIAGLLVDAQHETVRRTLRIAKKEAELEAVKREESLEREMIEAREQTKKVNQECAIRRINESHEKDMATVDNSGKQRIASEGYMSKIQDALTEIEIKKLEREKATSDQSLSVALTKIEHAIKASDADADALAKKMEAVTPELIAALQAQGDKDLAIKLAESIGAHALLKGNSMADVLAQVAQGVPGVNRLDILKQLPHNHLHSGNGNGNGSSSESIEVTEETGE
jgi:major vault protein